MAEMNMSQFAALANAAAKSVDPNTDRRLRTFAQAGVGIMKKEIQNMHAVDSGTMLNSVSAESVGKDTIFIGPTTNYAAYVALGTSRMAARPFHITSARKLDAEVKDFLTAEDLGL